MLKNRVGVFLLFFGGLAGLVAWGAFQAADQALCFPAGLTAVAALAIGWVWATAKAPPPVAPPVAPPPAAPQRRRGLAGLFRPSPPPPPPPPPPSPVKARRGLFGRRPDNPR